MSKDFYMHGENENWYFFGWDQMVNNRLSKCLNTNIVLETNILKLLQNSCKTNDLCIIF